MTTKFLFFISAFILGSSLMYAQTASTGKSRTGTNTKVKSSSKKKDSKSQIPEKYDPKVPILTKEQYTAAMNNLKRDLLERKLAESIPVNKNGKDSFNLTICHSLLLGFTCFTNNPEVSEVTRISPDWFKRLNVKLQGFMPIASKFETARLRESQELYTAALKEFKAYQESCLSFLKEKPPKISSEQLKKLKRKNTLRRMKQYNRLKQMQQQAELDSIKSANKARNNANKTVPPK